MVPCWQNKSFTFFTKGISTPAKRLTKTNTGIINQSVLISNFIKIKQFAKKLTSIAFSVAETKNLAFKISP